MKVQTMLEVVAAILFGLAAVVLTNELHEATQRTPEQIQRDRDIDSARRKAEIYGTP